MAIKHDTVIIVTAYNEADRLPATLAALRSTFPTAHIVVADDGSQDGSGEVALGEGAQLVRSPKTIGKGGIASMAAEQVIKDGPAVGSGDAGPLVILVDGDLAESAARLGPLIEPVLAGESDITIAVFARRVGGGFGFAVNFSRWATRSLAGIELVAPISGQRALTFDALRAVTPFAPRYGMETAMNIDAVRAGLRLREVQLELSHRATGKTLKGFLHRAAQLRDFVGVYLRRR